VDVKDEAQLEERPTLLVGGLAPKEKDDVARGDEALGRKWSVLKIVLALEKAGLETALYKSQKFDVVIIKIRASAERLRKHADAVDMKMRLSDNDVRTRLSEGLPDANDPGDYIIYPRRNDWIYRGKYAQRTAIEDTEHQCPSYAYYEYAYGKFQNNDDDYGLYHRYATSGSIFRGVDRAKLILSILVWPPSKGNNGAGLPLEKLLSSKILKAAFPLQDFNELQPLLKKWIVYWAWPWDQPVTKIKDYFGEKIGFYFLFVGHYTTWFIYSSIVGVAVYAHTAADFRGENAASIPFFCVFISLWTTLFFEFWKRKQARYAMLWGMVDFEADQKDRPE